MNKRLELTPRTDHEFVWIVDFPLFEHENGEWTFAHHPFTAPHADDIGALTDGEFEGVRAQHYDLVYNGTELGSGSIRITDAELQIKVLELLGVSRDEAERRFGFLLAALRLGAPPHGGFAVGFDRVVMLLAGADNLRDVIAFPKTTAARALFEDAPTEVAASELDQLGIAMKEKS
ncbi:MAG: amino acid--tRNA ligase-related protein [Gemmatimonadales bacterium]